MIIAKLIVEQKSKMQKKLPRHLRINEKILFYIKGGILIILNNYKCPNCNEKFPFFYRALAKYRRGFFLTRSDYKCSNCGQICRTHINFNNASLNWPFTAIILFLLFFYRNPINEIFFKISSKLSYGIGGLIFAVLFGFILIIGYRRGIELIKIEEAKLKYDNILNWLDLLILLIAFMFITFFFEFGKYIVLGAISGLLIWWLYNFLAKKEII